MRNAWVCKIVIVTLVGGLCLVGYGLAQAEKPIKPRFVVLSTDWVLDRTTALQWQKTPGSAMAWSDAVTYCTNQGGGARLPEIKELISLVDYSKFNLALPEGHPFQLVPSFVYWSATTFADGPTDAWIVFLSSGDVNLSGKAAGILAWCVR